MKKETKIEENTKVKKNSKTKAKLDKKDKIARIIILSLSIIIALVLSCWIGKSYFGGKKTDTTATEVKIDDAIDSYGYELKENATTYYKELFNKLKILLATEDFSEEEYAKLIAQMFVADFYNLDDKLTNSDVGGIGFVGEAIRVNFKLAAQNSIYNSVDNNIYGDRTQVLPKVSKVNIENVEVTSYNYQGQVDENAYHIFVTLEYEEDLGYPKNVHVILIHSNNKLEIAKVW